ncbi:MAG: NTP transferase domain-containing protein [Candidatus Hermodarchaeota archaeon]
MELRLSQHELRFKEKITSIILCAGKGTRAKEIAQGIPKPLIKIKSLGNQSILSLIIQSLKCLKLDQIVVVTGHLGYKIADFVNSLQSKSQFNKESILIHSSGEMYKLGPLYSLLSITTSPLIFKDDQIFIILPGDTVFDFELLQEILEFILMNYSDLNQNSVIFYREIKPNILSKELEKYYVNYEKTISYIKVREKNTIAIVKEISQDKLKFLYNQHDVYQIIPIFIFNNAHVNKIKDLVKEVKFHSLREVVNLMIKKKEQFFAVPVNPNYNFYDIDSKLDLKILNDQKKGGQ